MGKLRSKIKAKVKGTEKKAPEKREKGPSKEKPVWQDDLSRELAKKGLIVKPCVADGNCFFRACADQHEGDEARHMLLRQAVVGFMESHADDFAPFMEEGEDFSSYCRRMRKDGTWAGQQEQVAVARLHGVEIRVFQLGQPCWTIHPDFPEVPKDAPAWMVAYRDGDHYDSVRIAPEAAAAAAAAAPPGWSEQQVAAVSRGTGCEDVAAVSAALDAAGGSTEQAIELLVERLAAESSEAAEPLLSTEGAPAAQPPAAALLPAPPQAAPEPAAAAPIPLAQDPAILAAAAPAPLPAAVAGAVSEEAAGGEQRKERPPARNRPCTCGSGRRYKNCCGAAAAAAARRQAAAPVAAAPRLAVQMESLYV